MNKQSSPRLVGKSLDRKALERVVGGVAETEVARSGFLDSGPSDSNRIIERYELPGNQGA